MSEDKMSSADIFDLLDEMEQELGWMELCEKVGCNKYRTTI